MAARGEVGEAAESKDEERTLLLLSLNRFHLSPNSLLKKDSLSLTLHPLGFLFFSEPSKQFLRPDSEEKNLSSQALTK